METIIDIKNEYNSLDNLHDFLNEMSDFECSKQYDIWEQRIDSNGQMEQCLLLKKNNMNAVKMFFVNDNVLKINHVIPNKFMQAYFGKSQKSRQNILEIITEKIKELALKGPQKKAFNELTSSISKAS